MSNLVSYTGKIVFEPENKTKKHESQSSWKKMAMVLFDGDLAEYYAWFVKRRFNLKLMKPLRGAHISFINDSIFDMSNNGAKSNEEVENIWQAVKNKWDGKDIEVTLNLHPYSDSNHWWLIVDHNHREGLHAIRAELGLGRPYFGLHMSIGVANEMYLEGLGYDDERSINQSKYINELIKNGTIIFE